MTQNGLPRYPWDKWFKTKKFIVTKGKDFHCMTHSMVAQIRSRAAKFNQRVAVTVSNGANGKDVITVSQRDK